MRLCRRLCCFIVALLCSMLNADLRLRFYDASVCALNFSTDGQSLLAGLSTGKVCVINLARGVVDRTYDFYHDRVTALAEDDERLVVGYNDGTMIIKMVYDYAYVTIAAHQGRITVMKAISSSIVSGSDDKTFCIWDKNGYLVKRIQLPAAVSAIEAQNADKLLYIGCENGAIYRYNVNSQLCDELVVDLHKGQVTSLTVDNQGLFAGFGNREVVFFNFEDKSTKIFRSPDQIDALEIIKDNGTVLGASISTGSDYIWDRETACLFDVQRDQSRTEGPVAINRCRIAYAAGSQVVLRCINYKIKDMPLLTMIDSTKIDELKIVDRAGCVSGCLKNLDQERQLHQIRLCLRASAGQRGCYVDLQDQGGKSATCYLLHPLSAIRQMRLFREPATGDLAATYDTYSDDEKPQRAITTSRHAKLSFFPSKLHVGLYSFDMAITRACLTYKNGPHDVRQIRGTNLNGKGAVWIFDEDQDCCGPYVLSIEAGSSSYGLLIPYLSDQSEMLVFKGKGCFLLSFITLNI